MSGNLCNCVDNITLNSLEFGELNYYMRLISIFTFFTLCVTVLDVYGHVQEQ